MPAERLAFLSAVLLVSHDPERLVAFYREVLGLPLEEERHSDAQPHWGCEVGDVHFAVHPVGDYPEDPATGVGAVKLAFLVFDLTGLVGWLKEQGVDLCYEPKQLGEESTVTAVRDPDGNLVELTQLGPSWLEHLKGRRAQGHGLVESWSSRTDAV